MTDATNAATPGAPPGSAVIPSLQGISGALLPAAHGLDVVDLAGLDLAEAASYQATMDLLGVYYPAESCLEASSESDDLQTIDETPPSAPGACPQCNATAWIDAATMTEPLAELCQACGFLRHSKAPRIQPHGSTPATSDREDS